MTLIDTNLIIDAREAKSPFHDFAEELIAEALAGAGAAVNPIVLAELCVGRRDPLEIAEQLRSRGMAITDLPAAASAICARAFSQYRKSTPFAWRRRSCYSPAGFVYRRAR